MYKRSIRIIAAICVIILTGIPWNPVYAGWGHHVHINLLYEAVRILPVFDYEMCKYYLTHMTEGAVEGEYHFRYIDKGIKPARLRNVSDQELYLLNGIPVTESNRKDTVTLYSRLFESLKTEIKTVRRENSEILFDLAYLIQSVNNCLIPEYQGDYMGEHAYAHGTGDIDIRTHKIEEIADLHAWMEERFTLLLNIRKEWSSAGDVRDTEQFEKIAMHANEFLIYTGAALIHYVLDDCFGPEHPEVREQIAAMHEKRLKAGGGRKPGIGSVNKH